MKERITIIACSVALFFSSAEARIGEDFQRICERYGHEYRELSSGLYQFVVDGRNVFVLFSDGKSALETIFRKSISPDQLQYFLTTFFEGNAFEEIKPSAITGLIRFEFGKVREDLSPKQFRAWKSRDNRLAIQLKVELQQESITVMTVNGAILLAELKQKTEKKSVEKF